MMKNISEKKYTNQIITILCLSILFILSWIIFVEHGVFNTTRINSSLINVLWIFGILVLLYGIYKNKVNRFWVIIAVCIVVHRFFHILYAYKFEGLSFINIALGVGVCFISDEIRANVFKYFKYILLITSFVGVICFISYNLKFGIPYEIVLRDDGVFWIDYKLCYFISGYANSIVRFCGIFNEPGWFGTVAAFYLCTDNLDLKKKDNLLLFIACLLTLSLAFIILIYIYYILANISDWKKWIWLILLLAFYLLVLSNIKTGNIYIDNVIARLVISDGRLVGDNRTGPLFDAVWNRTISSGRILVGYGAGYAEYIGTGRGEGLSSIKSYIVNFGIIGTLIIFAPILNASLTYARLLKNKRMMLYIFITFISQYQRPYLFSVPYLYVYACGLSYIKLYCNTKR